MATDYEWDVETVNAAGDVEDHDHATRLVELLGRHGIPIAAGHDLVLVKSVGTDADGVTHRAWAYVREGRLPEEFDDGSKVPRRFAAELRRETGLG